MGSGGTAVTPLTPSGTVRIGEQEYDALSDAEYLDAGTAVTVLEVRNYRLIVTQPTETT